MSGTNWFYQSITSAKRGQLVALICAMNAMVIKIPPTVVFHVSFTKLISHKMGLQVFRWAVRGLARRYFACFFSIS